MAYYEGQDVTNTIHNYVRKFTTQICSLPIVDLDAALILSSKVSELSFLDVDQQHALVHAIDQRHATAAKRSAIGRGQQCCESLEHFLPERRLEHHRTCILVPRHQYNLPPRLQATHVVKK